MELSIKQNRKKKKIDLGSPALQNDSLPAELPGKPIKQNLSLIKPTPLGNQVTITSLHIHIPNFSISFLALQTDTILIIFLNE